MSDKLEPGNNSLEDEEPKVARKAKYTRFVGSAKSKYGVCAEISRRN